MSRETRSISEIFESMEYGPAPESPKTAEAWLEVHGRSFGHFIGGGWREPAEGDSFEIANPANGEVLARVARGSAAEVAAAVAAARGAVEGEWGEARGHVRARHLHALARQIQKHSRLFAALESLEVGRPIRDSRDIDVALAERHLHHHAGSARLLESEPPEAAPIGVVGLIIPRSFPLSILSGKVAPALATGSAVVLKPSGHTPLIALLFASICQEVGLPAGVVNVVTGDDRSGEALVEHPGVDEIAFTGSVEVGRRIRVATAGMGKRLSLELDGKSRFLVFGDADLDSAVEAVVDGIRFGQGEAGRVASPILAQEGIADRLVEKLGARMETLRAGDRPQPVVETFRTPSEAVALANEAPRALAASVWTENVDLAPDVARKVRAGTVWVNCTDLFDPATAPGGTGVWPARGGLPELGPGGSKDVDGAVEAARRASGWAAATGPARAQALYRVAETLAARADELARHIASVTGDPGRASREVELSIERLYTCAAWAERYEGRVLNTPFRGLTLAVPEPIGVMAVISPEEAPLLGFISTVMPAAALGNTVIAVPSERSPLAAAYLAQLFDTSDLPDGVVNIVIGRRDDLAELLAGHFDVDGIWYFGTREGSAMVERLSAGNMKRSWVDRGAARDWWDRREGEGEEFLRHATRIKNIWIPYGE